MESSLIGCHIIVVEDDYYVALETTLHLTSLGAVILGPAPDRMGALAMVANAPQIDAEVLDWMLRDGPCPDVADALVGRGVPFLLRSGFVSPAIRSRYPGTAYLAKPAEETAVARVLAEIMLSADAIKH